MKIFRLLFSIGIILYNISIGYSQIIVGAERIDEYLPTLTGKSVAICGNHTSRVGNVHLVDTLLCRGVKIVKIFCPEHGFRGEAEAGATIKSSTDSKTGISIVSLYGSNKKPTAAQMEGIDIVIFDIQDVGCRFYTYISTLHYLMEAAAENNVKVLVFDRPNPNGYFVDGPVLDLQYRSFVGMHPVPIVHGMTIGEYALMINGEQWLANKVSCQLEVITMLNWDHTMRYSLPYPPSPNLQSDEAIYLYPSLCLFEGTPISIGRGTDIPFQVYGAPELTNGNFFFTPQPIKGVSENPPQKGNRCRGYNLTDSVNINYNSFNINYLINAYQHFPNKDLFFNSNLFFDKLAGNRLLRQQIIDNKTELEIRASWQDSLIHFKNNIRRKYLLYQDF